MLCGKLMCFYPSEPPYNPDYKAHSFYKKIRLFNVTYSAENTVFVDWLYFSLIKEYSH